MNAGARPTHPCLSLSALRLATADRLRARRKEIEEAIIHRALTVAPPTGGESPGYVESLRAAIPVAIEHAFAAIELGEERLGSTPAAIFEQAAASARDKVGMEVVLRRYAAGYSTLGDFLHQEVRALVDGAHGGHTVLQRELTALFDRLVAEVSDAYRREEARASRSSIQRRRERIRRLLAGDLVDPVGLDYPLEGFHLAVIISGREPEGAAVDLARRLGRRLLIAEASGRRCAAWIGGRLAISSDELEAVAYAVASEGLRLSFGERGEGLAGWRRSRRQAEAAEMVAQRTGEPVVRYGDVALIAAALQDPDLRHFLSEAYDEPLQGNRSAVRRTLATFFESNRNVSATAAALGMARQTVSGHLRLAEEALGMALEDCSAQLETAVRLAELDAGSD